MFKTTLYGLSSTAILLSVPTTAIAQEALDEIVVTGSPLITSVDEAITGLSVLSGEDLANRLAGTIGETLKSEPGVSSTFFGAGASRPIIRGQGGDRVRVLTNGIGSIDASSASPDHAVAAEPAQAERIEVLRGASLLRYGSSGSGGIINVIDGRIPTEVPDGIDGTVRVGASTVDNGFDVAGSVDIAATDKLVLHLDGTFRDTSDYDIPGFAESALFRELEEAEGGEEGEEEEEEAFGTLENSQTETSSFTGGLSYIGDNGFIGFAVHKFDSDYGIPGGHEEGEEEGGEGEEEEEQVTIDLDQTRFDLNAAINLDGVIEKIQFFGGYADYEHTEFEAPGEVGTVFENEGYEGRLEAIQAEQNGWSAAYGIQIRNRDFSAIGEEAFVPPTETDQYGFYTFQEKEFGNGHLEGAARYERTEQTNSVTEEDISFDLFSLSAGGDIHLTEALRFGGTLFRTERAPTTEELFSNGPHLATGQFERGDVELGEETATGAELALRYRAEGHFLTVNAFYTDYDDYIFEQQLDEEEDGLPVFQFVGEDASFKGFEVQGGADVTRIGTFDIGVDALAEYVRAKTDDGDLPRIPPFSILAGIEAKTDYLNLRAEIDYAASQKKIDSFELPTESYTLVNLFTTWTPEILDDNISVSASILNLFDEDARQHTSFLKDTVPLPGRNFRVALTASF